MIKGNTNPLVYLVKNPITKRGKDIRKYFGFLSIAIIAKTSTQIDIAVDGISSNPLDKFNKTTDRLP